jgi:hypothetical protein
MKKLMISLMFMLAISLTVNAMSSSKARRIALFLTDKMAYELNLTDEQYEAAYEINYDYLINLNEYGNPYGTYWTRRNYDLSYILGNLKYAHFKMLEYFYRPVYWRENRFHIRIYSRYTNHNKYYFSYPKRYSIYNGEHGRRYFEDRSYYRDKDFSKGEGLRHSMGYGHRHYMMEHGNKYGHYKGKNVYKHFNHGHSKMHRFR